ncbi:MAG: hypothetical protein IJF07_05220 [Lachnospiraceae bacterium]|nr:hypothetical protein [Lachnospiraceae bacterium]
MNKSKGKDKETLQARKSMQSYLEQLQQSGTEFFVDDKAVLPREAVRKTVQEGSMYMADYVLGESGKIEQVRFDKVKLK